MAVIYDNANKLYASDDSTYKRGYRDGFKDAMEYLMPLVGKVTPYVPSTEDYPKGNPFRYAPVTSSAPGYQQLVDGGH